MNSINDDFGDFDIIIAGGGTVGCLAAVALAKGIYPHGYSSLHKNEPQSSKLRIAVIEAKTFEQQTDAPNFDERSIALSAHSTHFISSFGIDLSTLHTMPIEKIHVSDQGHIGQAQLFANNEDGPVLGQVVALGELGRSLYSALHKANVQVLSPYSISSVVKEDDCLNIHVKTVESSSDCATSDAKNMKTHSLRTKLLVIAEGAYSSTADMCGFEYERTDYDQHAVIANIEVQQPESGTAYERFTGNGPLAMLPMHAVLVENENTEDNSEKYIMSLVWTHASQKVADIMSLSEEAFLTRLQLDFGWRCGKLLSRSAPIAYPLVLSRCVNTVNHRAVVIGNSAQSLHPIAGQGFNLAVRDIEDLVNTVFQLTPATQKLKNEDTDSSTQKNSSLIGSFNMLKHYNDMRKQDQTTVIQSTDGLVRLFSNDFWPLVAARGIGLSVMNNSFSLKSAFVKKAMGSKKRC